MLSVFESGRLTVITCHISRLLYSIDYYSHGTPPSSLRKSVESGAIGIKGGSAARGCAKSSRTAHAGLHCRVAPRTSKIIDNELFPHLGVTGHGHAKSYLPYVSHRASVVYCVARCAETGVIFGSSMLLA